MANLLIVHSNRLVYGVQYPGISSISAWIKRAGHKFTFFDAAEYSAYLLGKEEKGNEELCEGGIIPLGVKPITNIEKKPRLKPLDNLLSDLSKTIEGTSPDVIGFSCFTENWPFTLFLIRKVYARFPNIPIIVGGTHATIAPDEVLKHSQVTAVCIGDGEKPLIKLLESLDNGRLDLSISNMWFRYEGRYIKNDFNYSALDDDQLFLDWDIYSDLHFIYPYEGKLYRRGSFSLSRGCPYRCTFCINNFLYKTMPGYKVSRKKVDFAIDELEYLTKKFDLEFLRFWDETFLALPEKYLQVFAKRYQSQVALPFTIETTASSITPQKVRLLADMGCQSVSIGVETSNEEYRKRILKKNISNEQYTKSFKILSEHGIRKVANFMFLLPKQTIEDMYQDIIHCNSWKIESPSPRIFYPYLGTELRQYCFKNDLINGDLVKLIEDENGINSLEDLKAADLTCINSVLKFSPEMHEKAMMLLINFILLQETPPSMHGLIMDLLKEEDEYSLSMLNSLRSLVSQKKYG